MRLNISFWAISIDDDERVDREINAREKIHNSIALTMH